MKTYEKYKPSGSDWFGEIPADWESKKVRFLADVSSGSTPSTSNPEFWDGDISWVTPADISKITGKYIYESQKKITERGLNSCSTALLDADALILTTRAPIGNLALAGTQVATNQGCKSLQFDDGSPTYYFYQVGLLKDVFQASGTGATFMELSLDSLKSFFLIVPPLFEQTAIADYLDKETARIDEVVGKKNRLIELLKEERLAIINHAVTRGLDPNAKLKPSNIEWLGDIPEHWEVKKLKFVSKIKYGLGQPPNEKIDGLPLLRATNVERGKIVEKDLIFVDPEDIPYGRDPVLKEKDILVVRSGAYTADSAIVPAKYEGAIAGYDMVVRVFAAVPEFIASCLLSNYLLVNQLYLEKLRAAQPHLNKEELGESLVVLPPIDEQDRIVKYVAVTSKKIEGTIAKVEKEIGLLNEYRTALISEVVTGKIKVV